MLSRESDKNGRGMFKILTITLHNNLYFDHLVVTAFATGRTSYIIYLDAYRYMKINFRTLRDLKFSLILYEYVEHESITLTYILFSKNIDRF